MVAVVNFILTGRAGVFVFEFVPIDWYKKTGESKVTRLKYYISWYRYRNVHILNDSIIFFDLSLSNVSCCFFNMSCSSEIRKKIY
jgi:hypothetical protein